MKNSIMNVYDKILVVANAIKDEEPQSIKNIKNVTNTYVKKTANWLLSKKNIELTLEAVLMFSEVTPYKYLVRMMKVGILIVLSFLIIVLAGLMRLGDGLIAVFLLSVGLLVFEFIKSVLGKVIAWLMAAFVGLTAIYVEFFKKKAEGVSPDSVGPSSALGEGATTAEVPNTLMEAVTTTPEGASTALGEELSKDGIVETIGGNLPTTPEEASAQLEQISIVSEEDLSNAGENLNELAEDTQEKAEEKMKEASVALDEKKNGFLAFKEKVVNFFSRLGKGGTA